jgi:hypothetical protein
MKMTLAVLLGLVLGAVVSAQVHRIYNYRLQLRVGNYEFYTVDDDYLHNECYVVVSHDTTAAAAVSCVRVP